MKSLKLAAIAAAVLSVPALGATTEIQSGTGQRSLGIAFYDPLGQAFSAPATDLQSFGFQIQTLNPSHANSALTLTLREGNGFDCAVLATRSVVFDGVPATRTPTWIDFDLSGTTLVSGQTYTALLTSDSGRYGLIYGPDINIFNGQALGGDAYLPGHLVATGHNDAVCKTGICDANFRFTAATAAVPEPAAWALMISGFGLVGGAMRTRKRNICYA
jgi:hypothetical protein